MSHSTEIRFILSTSVLEITLGSRHLAEIFSITDIGVPKIFQNADAYRLIHSADIRMALSRMQGIALDCLLQDYESLFTGDNGELDKCGISVYITRFD